MHSSKTSVVVTFPGMADTMRQVARMCPSIRRLIVVGSADGFVSLKDLLNDNGELFDDNIDVSILASIKPKSK